MSMLQSDQILGEKMEENSMSERIILLQKQLDQEMTDRLALDS